MNENLRTIYNCMCSFFEIILMVTELDDVFYARYPDYYDISDEEKLSLMVPFICQRIETDIMSSEVSEYTDNCHVFKMNEFLSLMIKTNSVSSNNRDIINLYNVCLDITKPFSKKTELFSLSGKSYYEALLDMNISDEDNSSCSASIREVKISEIKKLLAEQGVNKSRVRIIKAVKNLGYEYNQACDSIVCSDVDRVIASVKEESTQNIKIPTIYEKEKRTESGTGRRKTIIAVMVAILVLISAFVLKAGISENNMPEASSSDSHRVETDMKKSESEVSQSTIVRYESFTVPVGSVITVSGAEEENIELYTSDKRVIKATAENRISATGTGIGYVEIRKGDTLFGVYRFDVI